MKMHWVDGISKLLNHCMQISFGKLSQRPTLEKEYLINDFDHLKNILQSNETVSNICKYFFC